MSMVLNKSTMDYKKHYNWLIEKAQNRSLTSYTEKHHILPKCLGGNDAKENIVALTPEEHYVAHQLLVKMHPKNRRLVYALSNMTRGRPSNKRYGWVKRHWQEVCKQRTGESNGSYGKKWYYHPETLESGKFSECPDGWVKGRVIKKIKQTKTRNFYCQSCGIEIFGIKPKFCSNCRKQDRKTKNFYKHELFKRQEEFLSLIDQGYTICQTLDRMGFGTSYNFSKGKGKFAKEILEKHRPCSSNG